MQPVFKAGTGLIRKLLYLAHMALTGNIKYEHFAKYSKIVITSKNIVTGY